MNIIITGASRGIGYELVKLAAQKVGDKVIIISRNKNKIETLTRECRQIQPYTQVIPIAFDLAALANYEQLGKLIAQECGTVDLLINNAGFLVAKPFMELTHQEVEQMYRVNVMGPLALIQTCMPMLLKSEKSHVVNISSMGGFQGSVKFPGLAAYASSKAALVGLTECLAEEFKDSRVSFNCLALGAVGTEMLAEAFPGYIAPTSASEMASFIWKFAREGHQYFNGKIIPVSKSTP
jgi:short-subunit dehydrogenase